MAWTLCAPHISPASHLKRRPVCQSRNLLPHVSLSCAVCVPSAQGSKGLTGVYIGLGCRSRWCNCAVWPDNEPRGPCPSSCWEVRLVAAGVQTGSKLLSYALSGPDSYHDPPIGTRTRRSGTTLDMWHATQRLADPEAQSTPMHPPANPTLPRSHACRTLKQPAIVHAEWQPRNMPPPAFCRPAQVSSARAAKRRGGRV